MAAMGDQVAAMGALDTRGELHDLRQTICALLVDVKNIEMAQDHDFEMLRSKIVNLEHEASAARGDNKYLEELICMNATRICVLEEEGKKKDEQIARLERFRVWVMFTAGAAGAAGAAGEATAIP